MASALLRGGPVTALASGTVMVPAWRARPDELIAKAHTNQAFGRIDGCCATHERPDVAPELKRMYRRLYEQTLTLELSGYNGKVPSGLLNRAVRRRPGKHWSASRTRRRQKYIQMLVKMGLAEGWRGRARARLANGSRVYAVNDANGAKDFGLSTVRDRFCTVRRPRDGTNTPRLRIAQAPGSRRGEAARRLQRDANGRFIRQEAPAGPEELQGAQGAPLVSAEDLALVCAAFGIRLPRARLQRMGATLEVLYEAGRLARDEGWRSCRTRRLRVLALVPILVRVQQWSPGRSAANADTEEGPCV